MKILFTIDSLGNGGTERSLLDLISCFTKDTEVIFCYCYSNEELRPLYEKLPVKLVALHLNGAYSFGKGIKKLVSLIRSEKPDLLVSSLYRASIITRVASKITGVKLVDTLVEDTYGANRKAVFKGVQQYKFWMPYLLDLATAWIPAAWISNSKSIAISNSKKLRIPLRKIHTIYRGRDSSLIQPWKMPENDGLFHFAAVGRLYPKKGFTDLITAFETVYQKHPQSRLVIYGGGPFQEQLQQLINAKQLTNIICLAGNTPAAWQQLYKAHCFVFPSWYEGFSGALVEAMMMGIPIVASDIPMNLEAVEKDETALVYEVKNSKELSNCMTTVIENYPAMTGMGKRAREQGMMRFNLKKTAGEYESFLKSVTISH